MRAEAGQARSLRFTTRVAPDGWVDGDWIVEGAIVIDNPAPYPARVVAIGDRIFDLRVDDSTQPQRVQVTALAGERLSEVPRLQNYGFSCHPPAGSSALLISIAGSRSSLRSSGGTDWMSARV